MVLQIQVAHRGAPACRNPQCYIMWASWIPPNALGQMYAEPSPRVQVRLRKAILCSAEREKMIT